MQEYVESEDYELVDGHGHAQVSVDAKKRHTSLRALEQTIVNRCFQYVFSILRFATVEHDRLIAILQCQALIEDRNTFTVR